MPQLTIEVPHALGQAEAVRRLQEQFSVAQGAYQSHISDLHQEWTDGTLTFGFRAVGLNIPGTMVVEEAAVEARGPPAPGRGNFPGRDRAAGPRGTAAHTRLEYAIAPSSLGIVAGRWGSRRRLCFSITQPLILQEVMLKHNLPVTQ